MILVLVVLLFPVRTVYKDGGTRDYKAILYRIVVWNVLVDEGTVYQGTDFYLFPANRLSIDELWQQKQK